HELADRRLDVVGEPRRLLDAGAGGGTQVQADLARVDGREEVAAEHRVEATREQAEAEEGDAEPAAPLEHRGEEAGIAGADPLEAPVEGAVGALQQAGSRA